MKSSKSAFKLRNRTIASLLVAAAFGTPFAAFAVQTSVNLGSAGSFAILSQSGITDVYASAVTGNVGASPITGAAIHLTCSEVSGTIFSVNAAGPLPCTSTSPSYLTSAVSDMQTAYLDAAGRSSPDYTELGSGEIGSQRLTPGLYKWTSAVTISNDVTLIGGPTDVFIFQVAGTLGQASATKVILQGVQAKNVFWQVAGAVTIGTTAQFQGILLAATNIAVQTHASVQGRLFAQTAVTLQMNTVTQPAATYP